jgi:hypothetical protein
VGEARRRSKSEALITRRDRFRIDLRYYSAPNAEYVFKSESQEVGGFRMHNDPFCAIFVITIDEPAGCG